jgi:Flp pilus assembly protein TadB
MALRHATASLDEDALHCRSRGTSVRTSQPGGSASLREIGRALGIAIVVVVVVEVVIILIMIMIMIMGGTGPHLHRDFARIRAGMDWRVRRTKPPLCLH